MDFKTWVAANRHVFGSEYEILFASQVLPLVEGLRCDAVTAQYHFVDSDGKNRYCDFIIIESEAVRIAIEIDGYDKRGTGTGMSHDEFLDWQRRQASLASQGWHVLRFANRDVRDEPARCAEHISRLLKRLRHAQFGLGETAAVQSQRPEFVLVPTRVEKSKSTEFPIKKIYKLLPIITVGLLVGFALWQKNNIIDQEGAVAATRVTESILPNALPSKYLSGTGHSTYTQSPTSSSSTTVPPSTVQGRNDAKSEEPLYGTLDCVNPMDWSVAKQHIGRVVIVTGPLLAAKQRPDVAGSPMWLDIGGIYPSRNRLNVVVWGKNWPKFKVQEADKGYWFKIDYEKLGHASICIKGMVAEYKGVPQIELQDPSQVRIGFHLSYH